MRTTKTFCSLSDLHGDLAPIVSPCDFLLIAGDILPLNIQRDSKKSMGWIRGQFKDWLNKQPASHKVIIAGNHDFVFEQTPSYRTRHFLCDDTIHYLEASDEEIDGIRFYGSPYTPWFYNWAFNFPQFDLDGSYAQHHWENIPDDTQVLLTHAPPANILDQNYTGQSCGCRDLKCKIPTLKDLRLHVFGHIHESAGIEKIGSVTHINASWGYSDESINKEKTIKPIEITFDD